MRKEAISIETTFDPLLLFGGQYSYFLQKVPH